MTEKFADLKRPNSIFAVGAIHGEAERIATLHGWIADRLQPGDRLVYLGNMIGLTQGSDAALREILAFRRHVLAKAGVWASDIVYLRGAQEEMWQKLQQLQFAPNPSEVLEWMLPRGLEATLSGFGCDVAEGRQALKDGVVAISRWTATLRETIRSRPGFPELFASLRRAAYTSPEQPGTAANMLFVSAGLNGTVPLEDQGDSFWWGHTPFAHFDAPYDRFGQIIRGLSPDRPELETHGVTRTLDAGAGRGGGLACCRLGGDGSALELVQA